MMNEFMPSGAPLTFNSPAPDPKREEKKKVRRAALLIAIPLVFLTLFSNFWFLLLTGVLSTFGISPKTTYEFVFEAGTREAVQLLLSMILFLLPFSVVAKASKHRLSDLVPTAAVSVKEGGPLFLFGVGFCAFANIATSIAGQIFQNFGVDYSVDFGDSPRGIYGFCLAVLSTAVVPALVEEFATRGVVMGLLKPFGDGFSILVSSILFGAMHGNFQQMPFAFLVGLVLGYIRVATGSIWVCVLVHGFNNLLSTLFDYFLNDLTAAEKNTAFLIVLMVMLLIGILSMKTFREGRVAATLKSAKEEEVTAKERAQWFFSSPWILLFLVIVLVESCAFFV